MYDYNNLPDYIADNIYRRHEFCRCTVTFQSEKTSQNVWSKRTWESTPEEIKRRKEVGKTPSMTEAEQKSRAETIARDLAIKEYQQGTGYARATARRETLRKSPDEIQAKIKKIQEMQESMGWR